MGRNRKVTACVNALKRNGKEREGDKKNHKELQGNTKSAGKKEKETQRKPKRVIGNATHNKILQIRTAKKGKERDGVGQQTNSLSEPMKMAFETRRR